MRTYDVCLITKDMSTDMVQVDAHTQEGAEYKVLSSHHEACEILFTEVRKEAQHG